MNSIECNRIVVAFAKAHRLCPWKASIRGKDDWDIRQQLTSNRLQPSLELAL